MSEPNSAQKQIADNLVRELSDRGQIVEGGWRAYELLSGLSEASEPIRREMRNAFFLGAQHTFASVIGMLEPGTEPTQQDLERMTLLFNELETFKKEIQGAYPQ